ncbi:hypothetical protein JMI89_06145 [Frischella sp. Ac48]|uniref:polymorphic toxin type 17 domain-containing protein n=1 Tax=Frischella sp. Ac48 TaxID=2804531 RepID=UPI001C7D991C|nr:polymorphic toxin type 17 domain-containing protein [Frischella sp. Ac48]MBX4133208.1 hypothetical protein [Frischella sp. Ac48]
MQVAGGILTLTVAGTIEGASFGTGTAVAIALGFIGSDNIAAGISRMLTDKEVTTLGEDVIAWSGLVPKGYEGITYGLVDLALGSKTMLLSKVPSAAHNIVSIKYVTQLGKKPSFIRDIRVYVEKLSKNSRKQRHVVELKEPTFNPFGSMGAAKPWTIAQRLKYAKLPTTGKIRFIPDSNYSANNPLSKGPRNGYLDKFGNEWVKGPSRTTGQEFEWDVQLSPKGRIQLSWATKDGSHLNVSLDGKITHK